MRERERETSYFVLYASDFSQQIRMREETPTRSQKTQEETLSEPSQKMRHTKLPNAQLQRINTISEAFQAISHDVITVSQLDVPSEPSFPIPSSTVLVTLMARNLSWKIEKVS